MNLLDYIKETLSVNGTLLGFEYQGKDGNIDPFYSGENTYPLYFDGQEFEVNSLDEVFSTHFICGKTLTEVMNQIIITES